MYMKQVDSVLVSELKEMAEQMYGDLVKAVVDVEKSILVVDMEMHADGEQYLLENGSDQASLWGINFYPDQYGTKEFIEFDSLINIRPKQQNMSREVQDGETRKRIRNIVESIVQS